MRTFEERMKEIKRRSQVILERRKKRTRLLLATCIPLVLCLGLLGVWHHSGVTAEESLTEPMELMEEEWIVEETAPATYYMESATFTAITASTDFSGISTEILSVEQGENGVILRVRWKNETEYSAIYGAAFQVEAQKGEEWKPLDMKENTAFPAIAYSLEPGQEREETYTLGWVYDLEEPGEYRFVTDAYVYTTQEASELCELWATFHISE